MSHVGQLQKPVLGSTTIASWLQTILVDIGLPLFMEEILGDFSHYVQDFIHPRWCKISSIHSMCSIWWLAIHGEKLWDAEGRQISNSCWPNCHQSNLDVHQSILHKRHIPTWPMAWPATLPQPGPSSGSWDLHCGEGSPSNLYRTCRRSQGTFQGPWTRNPPSSLHHVDSRTPRYFDWPTRPHIASLLRSLHCGKRQGKRQSGQTRRRKSSRQPSRLPSRSVSFHTDVLILSH